MGDIHKCCENRGKYTIWVIELGKWTPLLPSPPPPPPPPPPLSLWFPPEKVKVRIRSSHLQIPDGTKMVRVALIRQTRP